jgi:subtilisin family serine protease
MRASHHALLGLAAIAALGIALAGSARAQGKYYVNGNNNAQNNQTNNGTANSKAPPRVKARRYQAPKGAIANTKTPGKAASFVSPQGNAAVTVPPRNGGYRGPYGGGYRTGYPGGWRPARPGPGYDDPDYTDPYDYPPADNAPVTDGNRNAAPQAPPPPQNTARRNPSGVPPANERRMAPDEVVIELSNGVTPQQIDALQRRFNLIRIESRTSLLANTTVYRWRIPDRRSVAAVVRALEAGGGVASAQPNYLFTTRQSGAGETADNGQQQYLLAKLHLQQAHAIAMGDNVRVAVIDSGVDTEHPELAGAIAAKFDTLTKAFKPDNHGTAIAGLIAAHGKLTGAAPHARILAVRAFDPKGTTAEGSTFNILKGLDWAAANHARIINMSFAGPNDPAIHRSLDAAHKKNIVLIAAAGNAGPKSPPLYPAADPNVIAVTATDADNKLFPMSNRGRYVAVAAPGTNILVAIPDGAYEVGSGTSYSAAEVSGIAALMIQHKPDLTPDRLRDILLATAKDLGAKGRDDLFGAGLADAYAALTADGGAPVAQAVPLPVSRASAGVR